MPIIGIDKGKCTNCKTCINECVFSNYSIDENIGEVIFDATQGCILCGHCIAVCSEDAIKFKDMKDDALNFEANRDPSELISYDTMHQFLRAK